MRHGYLLGYTTISDGDFPVKVHGKANLRCLGVYAHLGQHILFRMLTVALGWLENHNKWPRVAPHSTSGIDPNSWSHPFSWPSLPAILWLRILLS